MKTAIPMGKISLIAASVIAIGVFLSPQLRAQEVIFTTSGFSGTATNPGDLAGGAGSNATGGGTTATAATAIGNSAFAMGTSTTSVGANAGPSAATSGVTSIGTNSNFNGAGTFSIGLG